MLGRASIAFFLSLLLSNGAPGQPVRLNLAKNFPVLQVGNALWIGTPAGLYQYNSTDDSYKRFTIPGKRVQPVVRQLLYNKEWLWCVLDTGLAALQVTLNDWISFDSTNGLPSNSVTGIDFQEDFVWISTPNGLARFDLTIEQWEKYGAERGVLSPSIIDAKVVGSDLWIASDSGISSYSPQFEKWRHFSIPDTTGAVSRAFLLGEELWLVCEKGLLRFSTLLERQQFFAPPYLTEGRLNELYLEEGRIWAVTQDGLFTFEKSSGLWREFEGNAALREVSIKSACVAPEEIWITSESNTLLWNRVSLTWEILDYSSGLSASGYGPIYSDGVLTLLFRTNDLEYRKSAGSPWRLFYFGEKGAVETTANPLRSLFDNPEGGSVVLGDHRWGWQGTRIAFLQNGSRQFNSDGSAAEWSTSTARQFDVKSQLDMPGNRRISGFYNTVDFTETKYGVRFRGNDSDYVREFTWGDFRREQTFPFAVPTEMFGTNLWLQAGPKTERFKRSLLAARGTAGQSRSRRTYEHLTGASQVFSRTVPDRAFARNLFFTIPGVDTTDTPEQIEVYVDDGSFEDNTPATLVGKTIGGLTGDFDRWRPVEDFYFYTWGQVIRFVRPLLPSYRVAVRYRLRGESRESVLQDGGGISSAAVNFYFLGAAKILPYSFRLVIRDSLGQEVPLSTFGFDAGGMSRVDDRWVNFQDGVLRFPGRFPPEVYLESGSRSFYRMEVSGETEVPLLTLSHANLVRQSETIWLDGLPAVVGNDYVLDYTNGTLLFVREGILNPDTRIEIEYEYYADVSIDLKSASVSLSPSDNLLTQLEWQRQADSTDIVSLVGELRQAVGGFDMRLIPGGQFQMAENALTGRSIEGLLSSSWLRVQSKYEDYGRQYRNLYRAQSVVGEVARRIQAYSSVDISHDLRIAGDWKSTEGYRDERQMTPSDRSLSGSLLFHRENLPGTQLQVQSVRTTLSDSTTEKRFVQNLLEYQFPGSWLSALSLKNVKLEQFTRYGRQSASSATGFTKSEFLQTYYRLNTILTDQIQAGFFYRGSTVHDVSVDGVRAPVSSSERLLGDFTYAEWRFMQFNARLENTLQRYSHRGSSRGDYALRLFRQANVRVSPGELWATLSSLFFEVNHNQSVVEAGVADYGVGSWLWKLAPPDGSGSGSQSVLRSTYIKNEFRPGSRWLLQSLFEWTTQDQSAGASVLSRSSWRLDEKLDMKIGLSSRLVLQYKQFWQDLAYGRTIKNFEPSVWLEHRWTSDLLTVAQVLYRRSLLEEYGLESPAREYQTNLDLVWRRNDFIGMRYCEIRQTLFGLYRKTESSIPSETVQFSAGTSLDLYPIHSLILRLRADIARMSDLLTPARGYTTVSYSGRLSLQL